METKDLLRAKAVLEKEGFELHPGTIVNQSVGLFYIKKLDIWEGVEFFQYINEDLMVNEAQKVKEFYTSVIRGANGYNYEKEYCKPLTESAYVEQLKKEAFERFGKIQEGDRFDQTSIKSLWGFNEIAAPFEDSFCFTYKRDLDQLFIGTLCVYEQGKWANKLPDRITVEVGGGGNRTHSFGFVIKGIDKLIDSYAASQFLAQQLEKHLNGEIE